MGWLYHKDEWVKAHPTDGERALPEAYERLLLDALQGDASLFARSDEIELAWTLVDPMTVARQPEPYAPGTDGPPLADMLLALEGHRWLMGCAHK